MYTVGLNDRRQLGFTDATLPPPAAAANPNTASVPCLLTSLPPPMCVACGPGSTVALFPEAGCVIAGLGSGNAEPTHRPWERVSWPPTQPSAGTTTAGLTCDGASAASSLRPWRPAQRVTYPEDVVSVAATATHAAVAVDDAVFMWPFAAGDHGPAVTAACHTTGGAHPRYPPLPRPLDAVPEAYAWTGRFPPEADVYFRHDYLGERCLFLPTGCDAASYELRTDPAEDVPEPLVRDPSGGPPVLNGTAPRPNAAFVPKARADHSTPRVSSDSIVEVSGGALFVVVRTRLGAVFACGDGSSGQLGCAPVTVGNHPVPYLVKVEIPPLEPGTKSAAANPRIVTAVAAGGSHVVACCADGSVVTWGDNRWGQLGRSTETVEWGAPAVVAVSDRRTHSAVKFTAVAAGDRHTALMTHCGRLFVAGHCWGDVSPQPTGRWAPTDLAPAGFYEVALPGSARTVCAGGGQRERHTIVVTDAGIFGFGHALSGQLGSANEAAVNGAADAPFFTAELFVDAPPMPKGTTDDHSDDDESSAPTVRRVLARLFPLDLPRCPAAVCDPDSADFAAQYAKTKATFGRPQRWRLCCGWRHSVLWDTDGGPTAEFATAPEPTVQQQRPVKQTLLDVANSHRAADSITAFLSNDSDALSALALTCTAWDARCRCAPLYYSVFRRAAACGGRRVRIPHHATQGNVQADAPLLRAIDETFGVNALGISDTRHVPLAASGFAEVFPESSVDPLFLCAQKYSNAREVPRGFVRAALVAHFAIVQAEGRPGSGAIPWRSIAALDQARRYAIIDSEDFALTQASVAGGGAPTKRSSSADGASPTATDLSLRDRMRAVQRATKGAPFTAEHRFPTMQHSVNTPCGAGSVSRAVAAVGNLFRSQPKAPGGKAPGCIMLRASGGVGNTTMLYGFVGCMAEDVITTIPTTGFNVETLQVPTQSNLSLSVWDVGGGDRINALWRHYLPMRGGKDDHAINPVVLWTLAADWCDRSSMEREREAFDQYCLSSVLGHGTHRRRDILFVVNKGETVNAARSVADAALLLHPARFAELPTGPGSAPSDGTTWQRPRWRIVGASAYAGIGVEAALEWVGDRNIAYLQDSDR